MCRECVANVLQRTCDEGDRICVRGDRILSLVLQCVASEWQCDVADVLHVCCSVLL